MDYEDMIFARQEAQYLSEDADNGADDCSKCEYIEYCRRGEEPPHCPFS